MQQIIVSICLLFALSSCAPRHYVMHPNALSVGESRAYDAVNDANTLLDKAHEKFIAGTLPAGLKPAYNKLTDAFNDAYPALLAYDTAARNKAPDVNEKLKKLNDYLPALIAALTAFKGAQQ